MFKRNLRWVIKEFIPSWYAIAWAVLFIILILIITNSINLKAVKVAGFEVEFAGNAQQLNVYNTEAFRAIKGLNEKELKLFLIMGGEEANYYRFTDVSIGFQPSLDIYQKLQKDSLIRIETNYRDSTIVTPTEVGSKVHRALIKSIYKQLND